MKDANEILGIVLGTVVSIYKRPKMHGTLARSKLKHRSCTEIGQFVRCDRFSLD